MPTCRLTRERKSLKTRLFKEASRGPLDFSNNSDSLRSLINDRTAGLRSKSPKHEVKAASTKISKKVCNTDREKNKKSKRRTESNLQLESARVSIEHCSGDAKQ